MIKDILKMDNVRIVFRNFSGVAGPYNREGDRNFAVVIDDPNVADALARDGWNVKIKEPREEGDDPFCFLTVKVHFSKDNPRLNPTVYLRTGEKMTRLSEDTVNVLDSVDIIGVDLDIRPYNWEVNGKEGVTAYLQGICVTQEIDRFMLKYAEEEHPQE